MSILSTAVCRDVFKKLRAFQSSNVFQRGLYIVGSAGVGLNSFYCNGSVQQILSWSWYFLFLGPFYGKGLCCHLILSLARLAISLGDKHFSDTGGGVLHLFWPKIYWAPKETIHSIYLKLFFCKNETQTFVVRNVILGVYTPNFSTNYGFPTKDVDVDPPSVTWGSIYKITRLQKVHYFFISTHCGRKLLNYGYNFKEQMYHTLIVKNVETWTWRHFRSNADCIPSLFSIEMHNPFIDMQ